MGTATQDRLRNSGLGVQEKKMHGMGLKRPQENPKAGGTQTQTRLAFFSEPPKET